MQINLDIKKIFCEGKNVTHILSLDVQAEDYVKKFIYDTLYYKINEKDIIKTYENHEMKVKWRTFDKKHYYTDLLLYNDLGIEKHTDAMLSDLIEEIISELPDFTFTVNHTITKLLSKKLC